MPGGHSMEGSPVGARKSTLKQFLGVSTFNYRCVPYSSSVIMTASVWMEEWGGALVGFIQPWFAAGSANTLVAGNDAWSPLAGYTIDDG